MIHINGPPAWNNSNIGDLVFSVWTEVYQTSLVLGIFNAAKSAPDVVDNAALATLELQS